MATLAINSDGIDFPSILFKCILEYHIYDDPPFKTCDDQRKHSWGLTNGQNLINNIDHLVKKTIKRGRKRGPLATSQNCTPQAMTDFSMKSTQDAIVSPGDLIRHKSVATVVSKYVNRNRMKPPVCSDQIDLDTFDRSISSLRIWCYHGDV